MNGTIPTDAAAAPAELSYDVTGVFPNRIFIYETSNPVRVAAMKKLIKYENCSVTQHVAFTTEEVEALRAIVTDPRNLFV